jgi:hypothetical protein
MHFVTEGFLQTGGALVALILFFLLVALIDITTGIKLFD